MARAPQPTWYFALVVVRRRHRGAELCALLESVASGRPVFPLELLGREMSV
jgi:hypothetical protein